MVMLRPISQPSIFSTARSNNYNNNVYKRYEDCCPTSHNMMVPNVTRTEYNLMDINNDGYLSLMEENGKVKEDLKLPYEIDPELSEKIKAMFDEGKNLVVGTIGALGMEMVNAVKEEVGA